MLISKKFVNFLFLCCGCDNKIDFIVRNDWCGVCRGKDVCVKCDGVLNLNVIISKLVYFVFFFLFVYIFMFVMFVCINWKFVFFIRYCELNDFVVL